MPTSTFYNDNLFRTYPFRTTVESQRFPTSRIVGAKILCSFAAPFQTFPTAQLIRWDVRSQEHRLTFRVESGQTRIEVPVLVPKESSPFTTVFSDEIQGITIRLTLGNLAGQSDSFSNLHLPLEPTCLVWMKHRGLARILFANASRARLPSCLYDGIPNSLATAYTTAAWWLQGEISDCPLLFQEGFNCSIDLAVTENKLLFFARPGAGQGPVQEFIPLGSASVDGKMVPEIPEWRPDNISVRPDGLPPNDQVLYVFSGAVGPDITHQTSRTVQVRNDIDPYTVSVTVAGPGGTDCL